MFSFMKVQVLYKVDVDPSLRDQSEGAISIRAELEKLRSELATIKDEPQRKATLKKIARLEKFEKLQSGENNSPEESREAARKILKGKNTENYSNSDLLTLKKKWIDIANLLLINGNNPNNEVTSIWIQIGDIFTVNFWNNPSLRNNTGAGDVLPPTVKKVKIEGIECERRNVPRPWYYSSTWKPPYQAIYDNYKIEILELGKSTEDDTRANEKRWKEERLEDMIDSGGKALSEIDIDNDLERESQHEIMERKRIRETSGKIRNSWSYGTDKPISDTIKLMADLNSKESIGLAKKIFHEWPATNLLIELDGWSGDMIKRMIALWYHEWKLVFNRWFSTGWDKDPSSWRNLWTFQIWWRDSTFESSFRKYESCFDAWIRLAKQYGITIDYSALDDPGQKDLITHLWYIQSQRGGSATFEQLRNPNLSESQLIALMHSKIQGWIAAIWESVVAQIKTTKIDLTQLA